MTTEGERMQDVFREIERRRAREQGTTPLPPVKRCWHFWRRRHLFMRWCPEHGATQHRHCGHCCARAVL